VRVEVFVGVTVEVIVEVTVEVTVGVTVCVGVIVLVTVLVGVGVLVGVLVGVRLIKFLSTRGHPLSTFIFGGFGVGVGVLVLVGDGGNIFRPFCALKRLVIYSTFAAIKHPFDTECNGSAACLTSLIDKGKLFSNSFFLKYSI